MTITFTLTSNETSFLLIVLQYTRNALDLSMMMGMNPIQGVDWQNRIKALEVKLKDQLTQGITT